MNNFYPSTDNRLNEARTLIQQMSNEELEKIRNSDDEAIKFVRNLSEIQQMETIKESLKERIKLLAIHNLDKEPILQQERQKLAAIHDELGRLREEYKSIRGQYDDRTGETNPEMIYILLQTAAADLERTTEQTAEDFFHGEKSEEEVTEFERRFIEERKRAHELKIKAEKFQELMQMLQATSYLNSTHQIRNNNYR